MKTRTKMIIVFLVIVNLIMISDAAKFDFKDFFKKAVKTAVTSEIIKSMSESLNNFINNLLANNSAENRESTKVVPVYTLGEKTAVGAVQVSGNIELLNKVKCVICIEDRMNSKYRVKAYIPSSHSNPFKIDRVYGVGVTAVIEGFI